MWQDLVARPFDCRTFSARRFVGRIWACRHCVFAVFATGWRRQAAVTSAAVTVVRFCPCHGGGGDRRPSLWFASVCVLFLPRGWRRHVAVTVVRFCPCHGGGGDRRPSLWFASVCVLFLPPEWRRQAAVTSAAVTVVRFCPCHGGGGDRRPSLWFASVCVLFLPRGWRRHVAVTVVRGFCPCHGGGGDRRPSLWFASVCVLFLPRGWRRLAVTVVRFCPCHGGGGDRRPSLWFASVCVLFLPPGWRRQVARPSSVLATGVAETGGRLYGSLLSAFCFCHKGGGDRWPSLWFASVFATGVAEAGGRHCGSLLSLPRGWRRQAAVTMVPFCLRSVFATGGGDRWPSLWFASVLATGVAETGGRHYGSLLSAFLFLPRGWRRQVAVTVVRFCPCHGGGGDRRPSLWFASVCVLFLPPEWRRQVARPSLWFASVLATGVAETGGRHYGSLLSAFCFCHEGGGGWRPSLWFAFVFATGVAEAGGRGSVFDYGSLLLPQGWRTQACVTMVRLCLCHGGGGDRRPSLWFASVCVVFLPRGWRRQVAVTVVRFCCHRGGGHRHPSLWFASVFATGVAETGGRHYGSLLCALCFCHEGGGDRWPSLWFASVFATGVAETGGRHYGSLLSSDCLWAGLAGVGLAFCDRLFVGQDSGARLFCWPIRALDGLADRRCAPDCLWVRGSMPDSIPSAA